MNIKGLTLKDINFLKKELKDIELIKKMDKIINKEIIKKNTIITEIEKDYLIKNEEKKLSNITTTQKEEEQFKINMLDIMGLNQYIYINNNEYFNISNNERFNKIYVFNRNFINFKLFIKNNYNKINKEDFIAIYKLFLINYKISDDMFDTSKILLEEKKDREYNIYNNYKKIYIRIINKLMFEKEELLNKFTQLKIIYNKDNEKKELSEIYNNIEKIINEQLILIQKEQLLIDEIFNKKENYNNDNELQKLYDKENIYKNYELFEQKYLSLINNFILSLNNIIKNYDDIKNDFEKQKIIYENYKSLYINIINEFNNRKNIFDKYFSELLNKYNVDEHKKLLSKIYDDLIIEYKKDKEDLEKEQLLIDKIFNDKNKYNNSEELEKLYNNTDIYHIYDGFLKDISEFYNEYKYKIFIYVNKIEEEINTKKIIYGTNEEEVITEGVTKEGVITEGVIKEGVNKEGVIKEGVIEEKKLTTNQKVKAQILEKNILFNQTQQNISSLETKNKNTVKTIEDTNKKNIDNLIIPVNFGYETKPYISKLKKPNLKIENLTGGPPSLSGLKKLEAPKLGPPSLSGPPKLGQKNDDWVENPNTKNLNINEKRVYFFKNLSLKEYENLLLDNIKKINDESVENKQKKLNDLEDRKEETLIKIEKKDLNEDYTAKKKEGDINDTIKNFDEYIAEVVLKDDEKKTILNNAYKILLQQKEEIDKMEDNDEKEKKIRTLFGTLTEEEKKKLEDEKREKDNIKNYNNELSTLKKKTLEDKIYTLLTPSQKEEIDKLYKKNDSKDLMAAGAKLEGVRKEAKEIIDEYKQNYNILNDDNIQKFLNDISEEEKKALLLEEENTLKTLQFNLSKKKGSKQYINEEKKRIEKLIDDFEKMKKMDYIINNERKEQIIKYLDYGFNYNINDDINKNKIDLKQKYNIQ